MRCPCGYDFNEAHLTALQAGVPSPFASYMLVNDLDYKRYIRADAKALSTRGAAAKAEALGRAAQYTGSLKECPDCGHVLVVKPHKRDNSAAMVLSRVAADAQ